MYMNDIYKTIKNDRSNIKENSLNAYVSNIRKVFSELFENDIDVKHFNKFAKVKKYLELLTPATRKNIAIAIVILLRAYKVNKTILNKYKKYFEELSVDYENNYNKQLKSAKDEKNWITKEEIDVKLKELENKISKMDMEDLTKNDKDIIQQHLVVSLYIGEHIPPMRNDYANMKISNGELEQGNYINMKTKQIILRDYKTDKAYGEKKIDIPLYIYGLVERWIKYNHSGYLLANIKAFDPMTKNGLTKYIYKIFRPRKVSTTILRKVYLTTKYPVIYNRKDMKDDAYIMGHSVDTQQSIYTKK